MSNISDPGILAAKVGVASTLAVLGAHALGISDLLSAGFVALACVSASAYAGLRTGIDQLAGSALGCALGVVPIAIDASLLGSPWALLPAMTATVFACFQLRLQRAYFVAGFTVLYLHLLPAESPLSAVVVRMEAVLVGIVVAASTNLLVSAVDGPRIAERRVRRVGERVLEVLSEVAAWIPSAGEAVRFESTFALIAELRADLAAATQELEFPGLRGARQAALRGMQVAVALEEATHLGKELAMLVAAFPPESTVRERLSSELNSLLASPGRSDDAASEQLSRQLSEGGLATVTSVLQRLRVALATAASVTNRLASG